MTMSTTTASASSLALSSLNPTNSFAYKPTASLSFLSCPFYSSSSLKLHAKTNISTSLFPRLSPSSRFLANVAVSSEYGQEEDFLSDGSYEDEDEGVAAEVPTFSPDLQLFVGNLPYSVDSSQLAGLFETAGNVEMVEVIYDKVTGRSRGFGFVTMSTVQEVQDAEQQFNGYEFEGRTLRVNSGPRPQKQSRGPSSFSTGPRSSETFDDSNRLYVGNLAWGVDNLALENLFSEQGKVVDAKVVYDRESGRSRGFGFVTYSSAEEVDSAIESLDGVELDGRQIRVKVAESKPRRQF